MCANCDYTEEPTIRVIDADLDGAELTREMIKPGCFVRGNNFEDANVWDALKANRTQQWSLPANAWERIFGPKINTRNV